MDFKLIIGYIFFIAMWIISVVNTVGNLIMLIRMNRLEKNKTGRTVTAKCVDIKTKQRRTHNSGHKTMTYTSVWEYEYNGSILKQEGWYYGKKWRLGDVTSVRIDSNGMILYEDTPEAKKAEKDNNLCGWRIMPARTGFCRNPVCLLLSSC